MMGRRLGSYLDREAYRQTATRRERTLLVDCYGCGALAGAACAGPRPCSLRWGLAEVVDVVEHIGDDHRRAMLRSAERAPDVIEAGPAVTEADSVFHDDVEHEREVMRILALFCVRCPAFGDVEGLWQKKTDSRRSRPARGGPA